MIGRVQLKRELMRLSKTLERRTSDRQCKANKMANETEQEAIERKASNMKQTARKRARTIVDAVIEEFVAKVKMGPDYVCTCCHRTMYKHTVVLFKPDKYSKASPELLEKVSEHTYVSYDGKQRCTPSPS